MAKRRQCSKCGAYSAANAEECDGCGVIFADLKREQGPQRSSTCAWNDQGTRCELRGILALSTNGSGPWYCRSHFDRVQHRAPVVTGNEIPKRTESIAVREWHAKMAKHHEAQQRGREQADEAARRVAEENARQAEREPGEDWEEAEAWAR